MNQHDYEIPKDLVFETQDIIDMGGLNCSALLSPADLEDLASPATKITRAEVKLKFSVMQKEILVQGGLKGKASVQCGRCLKPFEINFDEEFTQLYPTKDKIIDIMYITKQTLALVEGIQNICSASCRGLCGICGCNKNEKACNCKPPAFNQFACLKDKKFR